jgi:hypothetical protein
LEKSNAGKKTEMPGLRERIHVLRGRTALVPQQGLRDSETLQGMQNSEAGAARKKNLEAGCSEVAGAAEPAVSRAEGSAAEREVTSD